MTWEPVSKSLHKVSQHIRVGIARETSGTSLIVFLLKIPAVEEKGEKGHGERKNGFVPLSKIHFFRSQINKTASKRNRIPKYIHSKETN